MTARKPAAKRTAARKPASTPLGHDAILQNAVTAVVASIRAGRAIGHPVTTPDLALRLQVAAEEWARVGQEPSDG